VADLMSAGPNGPCPPPGEPGVTLACMSALLAIGGRWCLSSSSGDAGPGWSRHWV